MVIIAQQPRFFTSHFGGIQTSCLILKDFLLQFELVSFIISHALYDTEILQRGTSAPWVPMGPLTTAPIMGWMILQFVWEDLIIFRMALNYDAVSSQKTKVEGSQGFPSEKKTGSYGPNVMKTNSDKRG